VSRCGPPISEKNIHQDKGKLFIYSDNGQYLLILEVSQVRIISPDTFQDQCILPIAGVTHAYFSPLSTYIVTWQRPNKELIEDNLNIWTVEGKKIMGWKQRVQLYWPMIQWTQDEIIAGALLQIGKVNFFAGANFSVPVQSIIMSGISMFSISTGKSPYKVVVVIPQKQSTPGSVNIFNYPKVDKPNIIKTYQGDSVDISWNSLGTALHMIVNQDIDRSGKSYYGKKGLFLIQSSGHFESRVTAESIHDVKWNPNGKEFAVVYGNMPNTKITIFDLKCQKLADLGDIGEARNTLYYDPKGRILSAGGFGSLNGNIDFWDLSSDNIIKISSTNAFSSSYHEWCPDGYHFLTGVVAPRMRQDNGIKIFNYHGELIYQEDIPELFSVHWRPHSPDLYPIGNLIPPNPSANKIPPLAAPKPYRHPNFSGTTPTSTTPPKATPIRYSPGGQVAKNKPGGMIVGGELDDAPEPIKIPKKNPPPQSTTNSNPINQQTKPSNQNTSSVPMNQPNNNINDPMNILHPNPSNRREKSPRGQQPHSQKKGPGSYKNNPEQYPPKEKSGHSPTHTSGHPPTHAPISESEKRRRTLIKKIRDIQTLKQRQAAGETLNPAQLTKVASEEQLQTELDSLHKPESTTQEGRSPRHYKIENKSPQQHKPENNSTAEAKTPQ